jgi:hypothetical protein
MRIDYKPVYVANDGTEFDNEIDCKKYEESLVPTFKGIMLNYLGKPTNDYDDTYIVKFTCSEDIASFLMHSDAWNNGLTYDSPIGVYLYSERDDHWHLAIPCVQKALENLLQQAT